MSLNVTGSSLSVFKHVKFQVDASMHSKYFICCRYDKGMWSEAGKTHWVWLTFDWQKLLSHGALCALSARCCLPRKCVLKNSSPATCATPASSIATRSCWTFLITNNPVSKVLRNAGSKVQLLIARYLTNDNHLSSPALSQDSLDGKVGVSNVSCQRRILAETQMSHLISSFPSSSTTRATTTSSASSSRKTAAAWASPFQATSATWIQVIKSEVGGSDCERIPPCVFFFSISHTVYPLSRFKVSCRTFVSHLVYSAGVTVKSIVKGSTVDQDGRIHIGDIILSVSATETKKKQKNKKKKQKLKDGFLSALPNYK